MAQDPYSFRTVMRGLESTWVDSCPYVWRVWAGRQVSKEAEMLALFTQNEGGYAHELAILARINERALEALGASKLAQNWTPATRAQFEKDLASLEEIATSLAGRDS